MDRSSATIATARLVLDAETAADLMKPNPVSIREDVGVKEAIAFLVDKGFSAAPVIDGAGRPVGVLSRADILVHDREKPNHLPAFSGVPAAIGGELAPNGDSARVRDVMTPAVFSVTPETSTARVVGDLVNLGVHRLFVVDRAGVLIGVISTVDVLRHLRPECPAAVTP